VLFISCAVLSIILGSIGALYQTTIKRLLAYSAIANLGYILLGLSTVSMEGVVASIFYFFLYTSASVQLFYILSIIKRQGSLLRIKNISDFCALTHANRPLSFLFVFSLLSFAGIPPLAGFFGKALIFKALIMYGYYNTALIAVLFSVLTCVYYIRLVRFI